jgi:hypothetical protein
MRRRGSFSLALPASLALGANQAHAADYFVAPSGSDAQAGTEMAPFATLGRAQQAASPGDTVWVAGGRYVFSGTAQGSEVGVLLNKSGREGAPIRYFAKAGETPIFDFTNLRPAARIKGFSVTGSWLHLRGLELTGVQQVLTTTNESWCIRVEGGASHNVFEQLNLHHNEGPGLFIADGAHNLVLNVDSHHNYDADRNGENADGFGCHAKGGDNVLRGCRAWFNSDDGFDFINADGVCTVEGSWAFHNGFKPDSANPAGNGAGFKGGGFTVANPPAKIPRHVLRFNVSWANRTQGFYANHHEGGLDFLQNTAFDNGARNFDLLADEGRAEHLLRNNLAFGKGGALHNANAGEIDSENNSWDLGLSATGADVQSVSEKGTDGPRKIDGSLPSLPFLRPTDGGRLIDRGIALSFPFRGKAPELGAYESGEDAVATQPGTPTSVPDAGVPAEGGGADAASGHDAAAGPVPTQPAGPGAGRDAGPTRSAPSVDGGAGSSELPMPGATDAALPTQQDDAGCGLKPRAARGGSIWPYGLLLGCIYAWRRRKRVPR